MNRIVNNKRLLKSLIRYENAVRVLLKRWDDLNEHQRQFKPNDLSWGMIDLYSHLFQVERHTFESMQKRVESGKFSRPQFKHKRRYALLTFNLILPRRFQVPNQIIEASFQNNTNEIGKEWKNHLIQLREFIEALHWQQHSNLIFKHPLAGALTANQTLGFLYWHLIHHLRQFDSIQRKKDFPKS